MTFGERVEQLREMRGWSRAELADRAGIRREYIYLLETGHWFSLMGLLSPFQTNRLCQLNVENFMHRQPPLDDAQSDGGDFSGSKMDAKKIVHHPIHMEKPLQPWGCFGVHIGFSSKGRTFAAQSTPEGFGMIGMNVGLFNRTSCGRVFRPRTLIFGSLWAFFMGL